MGLKELLTFIPLKVGAQAPDFSLYDQNQQLVRLSLLRGRWVVLYFYPKNETYGCTKEACSIRDEMSFFRARDIAVLGVSGDSLESHQKFSEKYSLNFPLLVDPAHQTARDYGVLMPIGGLINRTTFVIDPEGKIADRMDLINWFRHGADIAERLVDLMEKKRI